MYVPKQFENQDFNQIRDFIKENGFGILISRAEEKVVATHIPMLLNEEGTALSGHISKANPQWKSWQDQEVLVIFNGPHAYISSSWYNHENVPTWNYIAVHVYGKIQLLEGSALLSSLKAMVDKYEQHSKQPVSIERMSPAYLSRQLNGVVGFDISISHVEAAYKLSQNRDHINHQAIIGALEDRNIGHDHQIAEEMKKNSGNTSPNK